MSAPPRVLRIDLAAVPSPAALAAEVAHECAGETALAVLDGTDEDWLRLSAAASFAAAMAGLPALTVGRARGDTPGLPGADGPLGLCDLRARAGPGAPDDWTVAGTGTAVTDRLAAWEAAFVAPRAVAALTAARLVRQPPASAAHGLFLESLAYTALQSGDAHRDWLARRDVRPAGDADEPRIAVHREGDTVTVELRRPARHNALDARMRDALCEVLGGLLIDDTARIVLTGAGSSFCSGGDLAEFGTAASPLAGHLTRTTRSLAGLVALRGPRLTVAVHGACVGAGVELASFAARVVATPDARFWLPEAGFGLIPGSGGTVSMPARIGAHRFVELVLTGERWDAATALAHGLVDEVAGPGS
ncbi:enoyl-CoA hydratase/isomerase family protein [Dactylosporangium sp. NPDC000555]|uniref:enoyl-CoA hydratase/isomerase family protein n=1 Tax=Dactylosporangium sp. NPDC000555 TaxID=3154260 RepID=UPI003316755D